MMATLHSGEQKNKLELYLNDVYEKECEFKIEQEEIGFIQTGIETCVQDLVDQILAHDSFARVISNNIDGSARKFPKENLYNNKTILEVYFPIQSDCSLQRYVAENASRLKIAKSTIIKVGSFYDGTKNNFPDEFDFIFPLLGIKTNFNDNLPMFSIVSMISILNQVLEINAQHLHYPPIKKRHQETRKLYFNKYIGEHGPAFKIQFIYINGYGEQRPIHVDLVPAYKFIDSDITIEGLIVKYVRPHVLPKTFLKEILSARNCLYVGFLLAFTEIEQHFFKNILSRKHVKVCRILKHLLNGNGDGENLEEYIKYQLEEYQMKLRFEDYKEDMDLGQCMYTSYRIKIFMICHHEYCINTDTDDIGPCVLQVLKEMSDYETSDFFPNFTVHFGSKKYFVCYHT